MLSEVAVSFTSKGGVLLQHAGSTRLQLSIQPAGNISECVFLEDQLWSILTFHPKVWHQIILFSCSSLRDALTSLQGLKFTPWCLDDWAEPSQADRAVLTIGDIGGQVFTVYRKGRWRSAEVHILTVCVFSQVSTLYFTSASISLFEGLNLRKDSDSAFVILWDELMKGHRSCYTVTHQGNMSAWVRKGRNLQLYYHPWWNKDRSNLSVTSVVILCTPVWGVWVWLGWSWTLFILLLKKCSRLLLIPKPSVKLC